MARVYFNYSNTEEMLMDHRGATIGGLVEAHEQAILAVRSLIMSSGAEDWRRWILHVNDDLGEEIFAVPFASLLGKPH
jgi:hypothetical protein